MHSEGDVVLDLSKHIKELRRRDGLSQEELAERIYVSRQTVSNWENDHSYPDVQSLLMLSVLFSVSLDELVKGDIEAMKNELDVYKMNLWSWVMLGGLTVGILISIPMLSAFGPLGLVPSAVLIVIALAASLVLEKIKKKHSIATYAEILAFYEGNPLDGEEPKRSKASQVRATVLKLVGGAAAGVLLVLISIFLDWALFG